MSRHLFRLLGVTLIAALIGCESNGILAPSGETIRDLVIAKAKWDAVAPAHYEYTLQRLCFCADTRPMRVRVRDGVVESVRPEESLIPLPGPEQEWYPSIEGLFALVASELARPAAEVRAEYDAVRGFPIEVYIDSFGGVVDDEVFWYVSDIRILL